MVNQIFQSAVGVDLGGTKLLLRYRDHTQRCETGPDFGAADLTDILKNFIGRYVEPGAVIGIAVPGIVERDTVVACDVLPKLVGWSANTLLNPKVGQVSLANDANAALHATVIDLAGDKTAITVMVGSAIGCGLMIDGKVLRGAGGWAGELGYWPVQISGAQWGRLDDVAGVLAEGLSPDQPCPVCGGVEHPLPARQRHGALTQEELQGLEAAADLQADLAQAVAKALPA